MTLRSLTKKSAFVAASVGAALAAGVIAPGAASAGTITDPDTATVNFQSAPLLDPLTLQLIPGTSSGVTGTANIVENGFSLTTNGTATGMDPNSQYVSLIYGLNSNADVTGNSGPFCADDGTLGDVVIQTPGAVSFSPAATVRMLQGLWLPPLLVGTNNSTLATVKSTDPATGIALIQGKTMSIRKATLPLDALNLFRDIRPQVFQIQACGLITPTNNSYTPAYPVP